MYTGTDPSIVGYLQQFIGLTVSMTWNFKFYLRKLLSRSALENDLRGASTIDVPSAELSLNRVKVK